MKLIINFFCCLFLSQLACGQYNFVANTASTYQYLQNPTSLNNNTTWETTFAFPLAYHFDFVIDSQTYTSCQVMAGGGLRFLGTEQKELFVVQNPYEGYLLDDRGDSTSLSPIGFEIDSSGIHSILKIEWRNAGFIQVGATANPNDSINFQIWLYEGSNCIEIHYGPSSASASSYVSSTGSAFKFVYEDCNNILGLEGDPNAPSSLVYNGCAANFHFLTGHQNDGVVYSICPAPVAIQALEDGPFINIFPNPVQDIIHIQGFSSSFILDNIYLYNAWGQLVQSLDYQINSTTVQVAVPDISKGMYFLAILGENNRLLTQKIFIE